MSTDPIEFSRSTESGRTPSSLPLEERIQAVLIRIVRAIRPEDPMTVDAPSIRAVIFGESFPEFTRAVREVFGVNFDRGVLLDTIETWKDVAVIVAQLVLRKKSSFT